MRWRQILVAAVYLVGVGIPQAYAVPITFTKLSGITGGSPAGTAVYRADLSTTGIASVLSITITDNSGGLGGAAGQFSGFDLDAIMLSTVNCASAGCAAGTAGLSVFDFTAGLIFIPGAQRPPLDTKLFGTGPTGATVDNAIATLGSFDGNSTTAIPGANGFLSMGDGGVLTFNLTAPTSTSGLFLYIGEVGDNGEVAASTIDVRETTVPEPATIALLGIGIAGLGFARRKLAS